MTARFDTLNLSNLPPPQVVQSPDYEAILAARLADLQTRFSAAGLTLDTTGLETEPAVILQQEDAYRELLDLASINDAAKSVMLPFAVAGDLDNLAAFYGVQRLTLVPADPANGVAAVMESNDDLRARCLLAPNALPYAGLTGAGYRSLARLTAPSVMDVNTIKRDGGRVDVILLGRDGDGTVPDSVVSAVYAAFQDDDATQLTDVVSVRSATIIPYTISATLNIPRGPDPSLVQTAAQNALAAYTAARRKIGLGVYLTGLYAAAQVGGVNQVVLAGPTADILPGADQAGYCTGITVTPQVVT